MTEEEKLARKKKIKYECDKRYREKNKEKLALKKKEYFQKNKTKIIKSESVKNARKKFYENHKAEISLKRKQKRLENIEYTRKIERERKCKYKQNLENKNKIKNQNRKYVKNKINSDHVFKLKVYYRNALGKIKRKTGFSKTSKTAEYLGCEWETFKNHIESKFEDWMTWDNWGVHKPGGFRTWNIDHIIPLAHFDLNNIQDIKKAFHYTNCRPYCAKKNLSEQHYR